MFFTANHEDSATYTEQELPPQFLTDTQVSIPVTESQVNTQQENEEEIKIEASEPVVMMSENLQESLTIT